MKLIRTIGLTALVALSIAAFPAAASATGGFESDSNNATLYGSPVTNGTFSIQGVETGLSCTGPEFSAAMTGGFTETLAPDLDGGINCGGNQWKMNGCKFEFHPGSKSYAIGPPGCGPITLKFGSCDISLGSQSGLPATYGNVSEGGSETVEISTSAKLKYSGANGCAKEGTATFSANWEFSANGGAASLRALGPAFYLAGEESGIEAEQPRFEAEAYPIALSGEQDSTDRFTFAISGIEGSVTCNTGEFEAEAGEATTELAVEAQLGACNAFGDSTATVKMNSCHYALGVSNVGPPYEGDFALECDGGDSVEIGFKVFGSKCTIKIGSQSTSDTVEYENQGTGMDRAVGTSIATGNQISYTRTGGGFCVFVPASKTNGSISGGFAMNGLM